MNLSTAYEVTISMREGAGLEDIIGPVTTITSRRKAERPGLATILFYEGIMAGGMQRCGRSSMTWWSATYRPATKTRSLQTSAYSIPKTTCPSLAGMGRRSALWTSSTSPASAGLTGFLMTASTFRGRLTITAAYEEGPYAPAMMDRFLGYVDGYLPWTDPGRALPATRCRRSDPMRSNGTPRCIRHALPVGRVGL